MGSIPGFGRNDWLNTPKSNNTPVRRKTMPPPNNNTPVKQDRTREKLNRSSSVMCMGTIEDIDQTIETRTSKYSDKIDVKTPESKPKKEKTPGYKGPIDKSAQRGRLELWDKDNNKAKKKPDARKSRFKEDLYFMETTKITPTTHQTKKSDRSKFNSALKCPKFGLSKSASSS